MKRIYLTLLASIVMAFTLNARTYVLSVGVAQYSNPEDNLTQTAKDAKSFKDVMESQTKNITVLTSKYANKSNILEKLRAICNRAQSGDMIIFYFSGHGSPGSIATYDEPLLYQELNDILASSSASSKVCIIDACFAGTVAYVQDSDPSYKSPSGDNIIYLMSCRANEISAENIWVGHGHFTQAILKGMRGKADANNDKKITIYELFSYAYNDVIHATENKKFKQHPQLIGAKAVADAVIANWN